jgi:hypothetical protein
VPVAPAIRPCRFIVFKGSNTSASGTGRPFNIPIPIFAASPLNEYPFFIDSVKTALSAMIVEFSYQNNKIMAVNPGAQ